MTISIMNSRTFARDTTAIKRAAMQGSVKEYYRLTEQSGGPGLLQAMQGIAAPEDVVLDLPERAKCAELELLRRIPWGGQPKLRFFG